MAGVRVVEVSHYVAGPMIGRTMADLGAAVTKIELAKHGDGARNNPPFISGVSAAFAVQNLGKKSVCLDFKTPRGAQLAQALAARADVFIENFTPGVLAKYGLSYEELSRLNPRLIMCSVSSYGQLGPYAQKPGNDPVAMALSGVMSRRRSRSAWLRGGLHRLVPSHGHR
jgi:crotonobetainyl-CoA:carnitine CoA-transferase CaiB-like acyl-CoA transferase